MIAVDFDGTLLRGNSLQLYLRAGLAELWSRRDFGRLFRIAGAVVLRRLKLTSHARMKFTLRALIGSGEGIMQRYRALAEPRLNQKVMQLFAESGAEPVVVSAAFSFCIDGLVPFPVLATPAYGPELRGEAKVAALKRYLEAADARLEAVVTDSADDLPLLKMRCERRYLVVPSRRTLRRIIRAGVAESTLYSLDT